MSNRLHALTRAQKSVWLAQAASSDSCELQTAELIVFSEPLDRNVLADTIKDVLLHLPYFHKFLASSAHGPSEKLTAADIPISITDLDLDMDMECDDATNWLLCKDLKQWALETINVPVDFAKDGFTCKELTEHHLVQLPDGTHIWLARFHHILGDGFSFHAILSWILNSYVLRINSQSSEVAPSPFYSAVSAEHGISTESPASSFWAAYPLSPQPPALLSSVKTQTGTKKTQRALYSEAFISAEVRRALLNLATQNNASELAVLVAVVGRYTASVSGEDVVTLGLPVMHRKIGDALITQLPEADILPLTIEATVGRTIKEELSTQQQQLNMLHANSDMRSDEIRRMHTISPQERLFGPTINYRPFNPEIRAGSVHATIATISVGAVADTELMFQPHEGGFKITAFGYGTPTDQQLLELHLRRIVHMFNQLALLPESLDEINCALESEIDQILEEFNATNHPILASSLFQLMSAQRSTDINDSASGDRIGIRFNDEELSRVDMWQQVENLRTWLLQQDVSPYAPVLVHLRRSPALLFAIAAAVGVGAAWVPIDPDLPDERKKFMAQEVQPGAIISADGWNISPELPLLKVQEGTVYATAGQPKLSDWDNHLVPGPRDCAYVLFTSGSTGNPKAVAVPQEGIVNRLEWMTSYYGITTHDVVAQKTPSTFDVSVWEHLLPFTHGVISAVAAPGMHQDPEKLGYFLDQMQVTLCHFVPSALKAFLAVAGKTHDGFSSLRCVITSGEALEAPLAQQAMCQLGVRLHNLYGPTEAAIDVTAHTCTFDENAVPIGAPVWNTKLYVVDQWKHLVPIGCPGTLFLSGPQVALGYLNRPELTAERFVPDPFWAESPAMYDSGDIAMWTDAGELLYLGRKDSQVKLRGQRLELGEVEAVLSEATGVAHAAVTVVTAPSGQDILIGYVVPTAGAIDVVQQAMDVARRKLPEFMVPTVIQAIDQLPTTLNGKLDLKALPAPDFEASTTLINTPESEFLTHIRMCFAQILGLDNVPAHANFFASGGTSLNAIELVQTVNAAQRPEQVREMTIADIFSAHSPAQLVDALSHEANQTSTEVAYESVLTLREHQGGIPIFCFYPAGGLSWSYAALLVHLADLDRGVFAIQSPLLREDSEPLHSLEAAASQAVRDIISVTQLHHIDLSQGIDLVGWSVGGLLAHESAGILHEHGSKVRNLCLLDAYPAECWADLPLPNEKQQLEGVLTMAGLNCTDAEPNLDRDSVITALRRSHGPFALLPSTLISRIMAAVTQHVVFMQGHNTTALDHTAHLFVASKEPSHEKIGVHPRFWKPYLRDLRVYEIPVDHPGMMSVSALQKVARVLSS